MKTPLCIIKIANEDFNEKYAFWGAIAGYAAKALPFIKGVGNTVGNAVVGSTAMKVIKPVANNIVKPTAMAIGRGIKANPIKGTAMLLTGANLVSDINKNMRKEPSINNVPTVTNSEPSFTRKYF